MMSPNDVVGDRAAQPNPGVSRIGEARVVRLPHTWPHACDGEAKCR